MKDGKWLEPRYTDIAVFEKDFPKLDLSGLEVKCPGCHNGLRLNRKHLSGKSAGWCKTCKRAVTI